MKLRCSLAIAMLLSTTLSLRADLPVAKTDVPPMSTAVRMRVPSVEFKSVPLADVFDFMRDVAQFNFYINWPALEAAGVDRSMPISLNLRQIPLSRVLDLTLSQAGAGRSPIAWYVSDNIIYVTTRELADRDLVTRVYPVQDLLVDVPNFKGPTMQLGSNSGGSGGGGSSSFNNTNDDTSGQAGLTMAERGEKLVQLIITLVSPEVWVDNGGFSRIRYFNGNLIVTAPRSVQAAFGR